MNLTGNPSRGLSGPGRISVVNILPTSMKTLRTLLFAAAGMFVGAATLSAQSGRYTPLTTWPYLYEDFRPGRLTTYQGAPVSYDSLNVNLISGRAHYIQNGKIMETENNTVALLVIGEDSFVRASGRLVKVLRNTEGGGAVVQSIAVDTEAMNKADIGYGKSSIASTQNVSISAISGDMDYSVHRSLDVVMRDRHSGQKLEIRSVNGFFYRGSFIPASRTDVLGISGIDKDAVKAFLKREKIRFSNLDDLARLEEFLYSL